MGGNAVMMIVQVGAIAFLVSQFMGSGGTAGKTAQAPHAVGLEQPPVAVEGFEDEVGFPEQSAVTSAQQGAKQPSNPLSSLLGINTEPSVHPALAGFDGARAAALERVSLGQEECSCWWCCAGNSKHWKHPKGCNGNKNACASWSCL
jgi:hypothetical protein